MSTLGARLAVIPVLVWLACTVATAQSVPGDCDPQDLTVVLNTGWDQSTGGSVYLDGDADDDWDITFDAASGPLPRDADVTDGVGAWLTFPDSSWITSDLYPGPGMFTYEMCWCMDDDALNPVLDFQVRADNSASIFLNGNLVGTLPWTTFNDTPAPSFTVTDPTWFVVGRNCLTIDVTNGGGPSGLNLVGDVTADDGLCCSCDPQDIVDDASTGIDDASASPIASGLDDDEWIVTAAASGGVLPRPAEVIDPNASWDTIPGTKWVTAQASGPDGFYTYEKCWCFHDAFENAQLDIELLADNEADVYLNGTLIGSTPPNAFTLPATGISTADQTLFQPGENCLTVEVFNSDLISPSPTGFNASIQITGTNAGCCGCVEAPADLEAWWPLNEATGPTAFDVISAHDGTHTDFISSPPSPTPSPGSYVVGSLLFDGVDDHVDVPDDPGLNFGPGEDLSIDAWINTTGADRHVIVGKKRPGVNPGFSWGIAAGFLGMEISDGTVYIACSGSIPVNDGDWHFVAVTLDRDDPEGLRLWVDGVNDVTCDPTGIAGDSMLNAENLYIGGDPLQGPEGAAYWIDRLDEIELFRRALADTEVLDLYLAGTSGKCPPIPCTDSTGVPVCDGTCPSGLTCDYTGQLAAPCDCFPEPVACSDPQYPECNGDCPVGTTCQQGAAQDCECVPIGAPCEQSPYPECNGDCPQGGTCEASPVDCECVMPQPCNQGPYPECSGDCSPNEVCTQGLAQDCICEPVLQCGDPGDYPACLGDCPPGSTCDYVPGTQTCQCYDDNPVCGDALYPECNGSCPVNQECVKELWTDGCECQPVPPVCGDTLYPECNGACPTDNEKCVKLQSGQPGCECVACGMLGGSGLGGVLVGWSGDKGQVRWTSDQCSLWYNVYRHTALKLIDGNDDGLADDYGDCYQDDIIELEATDQSNPPVGQVHFYLVTGEHFSAEGSLGEASNRVERPNTGACP